MPNAIRGYTVSGIVPGLDGKQPKYRLGQRIGKNFWLGEHADAGPPREFIVRKAKADAFLNPFAGQPAQSWIRGSGQLSQGAYQRHEGYGGRLPRKREKTVPGKTFRV